MMWNKEGMIFYEATNRTFKAVFIDIREWLEIFGGAYLRSLAVGSLSFLLVMIPQQMLRGFGG